MPQSSKISHLSKKNHVTKKNKRATINLIFDLDATLINSIYHESIYGDQNLTQNISSLGPHQFAIIPDKKTESGHTDYIMFYRPFAAELLEYLAKHPNVLISVWSTGTRKYVENICKFLIGPKWKTVLRIVISRNKSNPKYTSIISQTGEVFVSDFENSAIKDLNVLFKHPKWGKIFNRKNTLLIDDNTSHYVKNKGKNIIHVPPWDGINCCDTVLFELRKWLDKVLANPKPNMTIVPDFEITNTTGMTTGNIKHLYRDLPTMLKTININNKVCAPKLYKYHTCLKQVDNKAGSKPVDKPKLNDKCAIDNLLPSTRHSNKSTKRKISKKRNMAKPKTLKNTRK